MRGEAAAWFRRAAEHAFEGNDFARVLALAERAIACAAGDPAFDARWHGEVYLLEAAACRFRGQYREMLEHARGALARLPRGSAPFYRAVEAVAHASSLLHDLDWLDAASLELLATDLDPDLRDRDGEAARAVAASYAVALARTAGHGFLIGHAPWSAVLLRRSEDVVRRIPGDPAVTAALQRAQAFEIDARGDRSVILGLRVSVRALFQAAGDVRNACIEAANIGCVYVLLGAFVEAERVLRSALAEADWLGLAGLRASLMTDLGFAVAHLGRFAEGIALEEEAGALTRETGARNYEMASRCYLARIALMAGDAGRAERECRSLVDEPAPAADCARALAVLSAVAAAQGRPADALAAAQQAMDILASAGALDEGEALIRLAHAEALLAAGDTGGAAAALADARAGILERAGKIGDASFRRCFLERVPENARILALAEEVLELRQAPG